MTFLIKKPLLADKLDDLEKLNFPCLATPKIDGIRALKINGNLISRQFKPIKNIRIRELLEKLLPNESDGEIIIDGTFQDVQSKVRKEADSENFEGQFYYYWFDYVKDDPNKPYKDRMEDMRTYISAHPYILQHPQAKIVPLYPKELNNIAEVQEFEISALRDNFEGVMIRKPDGKYKMGRSTVKEGILLKLKKFNDAEAVVIDVQELFHNNNEKTKNETGGNTRSSKKEGLVAAGKLGSLAVRGTTGQEFSIGSGFTDAQRIELWSRKDELVGQFVKYKYFEIGMKNAPRFPTFLGFRDVDDM